MSLRAALDYAPVHALLVARGDDVEFECYGDGCGPDVPHALYSGTKSFWGPLAVLAQSDGLLDLDEPVARTIPLWEEDARKRHATLRMLLSLTAGFGFGGLGSAVPEYDRALAMPLKTDPGTTFTYGGLALQAFGAVLARKLSASGATPHAYLQRRMLDPAGVAIGSWRSLRDGTSPLPTGAMLTARAWLAYGRYVLCERKTFQSCFEGSSANPRYGLTWWLGSPHAPADLTYASGAAGQALYLIPSLDLCIVRLAKNASYKHDAFLKRYFA